MRSRKVRTAALITLAAAAVGGVVALGDGSPSQDLRLLSGAAWLASSKVGQVTLLDGTAAEVSAQVQVAKAGNLLEVVQQGSVAYAVDQTAGTVRRVDGATFTATEPQAPIADPTTEFTAIPGVSSLYTLDIKRGILADTDPRTLRRRGEMVSVAGGLTEGTATVDEAGTFWAIDPAIGRVSRVQGDHPTYIDNVAKPGPSRLTMVNGHPVVVDQASQQAVSLDRDSGQPGESIPLSVRPDDKLQVSGSPRNERLYVVAQRGVLNICELAEGKCDKTVPLDTGNDFGAAVETGNRLFVPNYSTGQVWIVDPGSSAVVAKAEALKATGKFQLLTRDGLVFYNDTNSEKAGVITLTGEVSAITKYDPADPAKGVNVPVTEAPQPPQDRPAPQQPTQAPQLQPESTQQESAQPESTQQQPTQQPESPQTPDAPGDQAQLKVTMSDTSPTVDQPVELKVENTAGAQPDRAQWTFGDGGAGEGLTTSHKWTAPGNPFQITVKAFFDTGQKEATAAITITVSAKELLKLTVTPPTGGRITGSGINCPGACTIQAEENTAVSLNSNPANGFQFGAWGGACAGTTRTSCQLTLTAPQTAVSATFTEKPAFVLTVRSRSESAAGQGSGNITGQPGNISCAIPCDQQFVIRQDTEVTLTAQPGSTTSVATTFDHWEGAVCGGSTNQVCTFRMTGPLVVTAVVTTRLRPPVKN